MANPLYIYIDERLIEVQEEDGYHLKDDTVYASFRDPLLSLDLDGTDEQWRECFAKVGEWLAKRREEQS